jgi:hypothetical protein
MWPGGLTVEEHALSGAPQLDPLTFQPVDGTQEDVLARHADLRSRAIPHEVQFVDGYPTMAALGDPGDLQARILPSAEDPIRSVVQLYRGEEKIFSADAGLPSPALPLQALYTYNGHWALELLLSEPEVWAGRVYVDGTLANDSLGYDEAFGFQLLGGKPFYFFVREGRIGFSYDGEEADLGYRQVIHYRCCSESVLNPLQAEDMVAFFAERDGQWYYVELGRFDS